MRLRLRITGEGLKLTGSPRGSAAIPGPPPPLAMEPPHGQSEG
jgi:hypothetical protein